MLHKVASLNNLIDIPQLSYTQHLEHSLNSSNPPNPPHPPQLNHSKSASSISISSSISNASAAEDRHSPRVIARTAVPLKPVNSSNENLAKLVSIEQYRKRSENVNKDTHSSSELPKEPNTPVGQRDGRPAHPSTFGLVLPQTPRLNSGQPTPTPSVARVNNTSSSKKFILYDDESDVRFSPQRKQLVRTSETD